MAYRLSLNCPDTMEKNNNDHLKEIVEIVGVVSIVASLLLVAWEIRQTNRIAGTEIVLQLADQYDDIHRDRATLPQFAKLYPKLESPESHLVTATESSQMEGLAARYLDIFVAAQVAYDEGMMSRSQFQRYVDSARAIVDSYPGLHPYLVRGIDASGLASMEVLQPSAALSE